VVNVGEAEEGGKGKKVRCMLNLLGIIFISLKVIKFHGTSGGEDFSR
jgi:hypothetical protein